MASSDFDHQPSSDKSASSNIQSAVVINNSHIAASGQLLKPRPSANVSPMTAVSVRGYPTDKTPLQHGLDEIVTVTCVLRDVGIPCCMVAEPALLYYGTTRTMSVRTHPYNPPNKLYRPSD